MKVEQISVFLENKSGRLAELTGILGKSQINIRALALADTTDFGILRLIVNDPAKAKETLKKEGFTVGVTEVIAVEVPDKPGGLNDTLKLIEKAGHNVEYMYAFLERSAGEAVIIFRFEQLDEVIKLFSENGITMLEGKRLYDM